MIVVQNRVRVPESREETFLDRLSESHGIEEHDGFLGMKVLTPVDAPTHVTMTFWESIEDYEHWRESRAYDRAHEDTSAEEAFETDNDLEVHEVAVQRDPRSDGA